jgi:hypothetical protein
MRENVENALLAATLNPVAKLVISRLDRECPVDGNLILNSLRYFLGEPLNLCSSCQHASASVISPSTTWEAK